jgi:hypothetical protein
VNTAPETCLFEVALGSGGYLNLSFNHKSTFVVTTKFPGNDKGFFRVERNIASGKWDAVLVENVG